MKTPEGKAGEQIWRLRVFDSASGGPTHEFPYVINVDVFGPNIPSAKLTAVGAIPSNKPYSGVESNPSQPCDTSSAFNRPATSLEEANAISNENIEAGTPWIWFAEAGRYIYLELSADKATKARLRLYAKEASGLGYQGVCESIIDILDKPGLSFAQAQAQWDRITSPVWRIEIEPIGPHTSPPVTISARALREFDPARFPGARDAKQISTSDWKLASVIYQCRSWMQQKSPAPITPLLVNPPKSSPIPTAISVDVPITFGEKQLSLILRALRTAMGIWLANCKNCSYNSLSLIKVGKQFWLRDDITHPILPSVRGLNTVPNGNRILARVATAVGGVELFGSVPLSVREWSDVCARNPQDQAPEFPRILSSLGCPGTASSANTTSEVTLLVPTHSPTSCGLTANIIACEQDSSLVELNGRDYRFCLGSAGFTCFGNGKRAVDLMQIMLHEVGHWIGLGHSGSPNAIMASYDGGFSLPHERRCGCPYPIDDKWPTEGCGRIFNTHGLSDVQDRSIGPNDVRIGRPRHGNRGEEASDP